VIRQLPQERAEKRIALLQAVDSIHDTLAADADASETLRTLPEASVTALTEAGLWAMKCPVELGGTEADPVTQMDVIESVLSVFFYPGRTDHPGQIQTPRLCQASLTGQTVDVFTIGKAPE
jgi:hypothetical protein